MPSRIDAGDDASSSASGAFTSCKEFNAAIDGFVAAHADCTVDSDCAIVGDCSHADWRAIAAPFAEEANRRVRAGQCGSSDGPGANAVCDRGKCVAARASLWCGSVPETECPSGSVRSYAGCGAVASTYTEGCHVPCTESADESGCPQGYTCQTTSTDPCRAATLGQDTCAACGHEAVQCLPAPGCALKLSARFQGNRVAPKLHSGESTVLELWLENLTNTKLEVSFELPCHGPEVSGLAGYDVWNSCLAGVCQAERVQTQLTLQPHAKTLWRSAVLRAGSSDCNPDGLAAGTYRPSFDLNVSGVPTCGPEPVELTVAP